MQPREVTFECFNETWETVKKDFGTFAAGLLLFMILNVGVGMPFSIVSNIQQQQVAQNSSSPEQVLAGTFLSPLYWAMTICSILASSFVYPLLVGLTRVALLKMRGEPAGLGQMFDLKGRYWPLVGFGLVYNICLILGFYLCVIPGLLWYAVMLPASLIVLEQGRSPFEAMGMSMSAMKQYIGAGMLIGLMGLLATFVGILLCCVGFFFLGPMFYVAGAAVYRRLFPEMDPSVQAGPGDYYRPPTAY
jgi:hypothetical protein